MKSSAVEQVATTSINWAPDLDWVVVDTPPTSGEEVQSLLEHLPNIYGAVIITQPNDLSMLGISKTLNLLRETESPVCGVLVNMAGYTCPQLVGSFGFLVLCLSRRDRKFKNASRV